MTRKAHREWMKAIDEYIAIVDRRSLERLDRTDANLQRIGEQLKRNSVAIAQLAGREPLMLQDPENFEEWEFEVWAESLEKARVKCEYMAQNSGLTEVLDVTQKSKKPSQNGSYLFICWFRSEVKPDDSNN